MEPCENSRWWHLTSLKDHPSPFQPRRSYNILTAGNKMHLQSPRGGEGPQLYHLWPQPKGCGGKGSPVVPAQTHHWSSGLAPTSPGSNSASRAVLLLSWSLKSRSAGSSWYPGENISNSNNFLLDMSLRTHRGCCWRRQQNKSVFFPI